MMIRIALNMIMGKGDGPIARRFFESFDMRKLFDEIVLVTTDEKDEDVRAVINQYADKTGNFKWEDKDHPYGDFGGARNMALQLTNSEYIMWLDSDDVIPIEGIEICFMKIREVVAANLDRDYFVAPYVLTINKDGSAGNVFSRERMFRRASGIKWKGVVHEQLTILPSTHKRADFVGLDVVHLPKKSSRDSLIRNLKILESEYFIDPENKHYAFYFARDLIQDGQWTAAVPIIINMVNTLKDDLSNIYDACLFLAKFFLYKQSPGKDDCLCQDTSVLAERYLRVCFSISQDNAEPLVILGDVKIAEGNTKSATELFKAAISKKFGTGPLQDKAYYEEYPAQRLAGLYQKTGDLEQALWYNKVALKHGPEDVYLLSQRKTIIENLKDQLCVK